MPDHVLLLAELLENLHEEEHRVRQWLDSGLLKPLGFSEDGTAVFSPAQAERAGHIARLAAMGYSTDEIRRIIRKVGIPGTGADGASSPQHSPLTVGTLAERVGVSARTIKHWEEKGIIEPDMRSGGGFRLYSETFVYLCQLVRDLQLFGYSLEEIKHVSDLFRTFLSLQSAMDSTPRETADSHFESMMSEIKRLEERMSQLRAGIHRWEGLLGKKTREITAMRKRNLRRPGNTAPGRKE